jgi:hypothetical protein
MIEASRDAMREALWHDLRRNETHGDLMDIDITSIRPSSRSRTCTTGWACFSRLCLGAICDRLARVATTGLHNGSILRCLCWLQNFPASETLHSLIQGRSASTHEAEASHDVRPAPAQERLVVGAYLSIVCVAAFSILCCREYV